MGNGRYGAALRHVEILFSQGTLGNRTDAELLGQATGGETEQAEIAFAAIVERHGPMVLRVCRSVVGDEHDAQDAFQATFLVLVRRVRAVRNPAFLASWLYGVALRVAARARSERVERRERERRLMLERSRFDPYEETTTAELVGIVHEEVGRLPERYRAPVILCYLEGETCEAAARQLGWPVGTVKSRLSRGRDRLRSRLGRRRLGPESGLVVAGGPAVGGTLSGATVHAMLQFGSGAPTSRLISGTAISLAIHTLRTIQMMRFMMVAMLSLVSVGAVTVAVLAWGESQAPAGEKVPAASATPKVTVVGEMPSRKRLVLVYVRVINARGEGVPGTVIEVFEDDRSGATGKRRAGAEGFARIAVDPSMPTGKYQTGAEGFARIAVDPDAMTRFLARPNSRTIGWAFQIPEEKTNGDTKERAVVVELLPRSHTVEGLVVDPAGKPAAGVPIEVTSLRHARNRFISIWLLEGIDSVLGSTRTDAAGRYRLNLPERVLAGVVAMKSGQVGPLILSQVEQTKLPTLELQVAGSLSGRVVHAVTRAPVAGASVSATRIELDGNKLVGGRMGFSDGEGRFKIECLPPGVYELLLENSALGERFTAVAQEGLRIKPGVVTTTELTVIEGRRVHGTLVDFASGKAMNGEPVYCMSPASPGASTLGEVSRTGLRGLFEFFVPPGPVKVYCRDRDNSMLNPWVDGPHLKTLTVEGDRDPADIALKGGAMPDDQFKWHGTVTSDKGVVVRMRLGSDPPQDGSRTIMGRIFDQQHKPIAAVSVEYSFFDPRGRTIQNGTDQQGLFRMKGLLRGEGTLTFMKTGYRTRRYRIQPRDSEFEITLEKRG